MYKVPERPLAWELCAPREAYKTGAVAGNLGGAYGPGACKPDPGYKHSWCYGVRNCIWNQSGSLHGERFIYI
jgi:hypothetical protein